MTATVAGIHLGLDTHANRPAANTVPDGSIYSCSTHNLVYKSNLSGNSWATWATLGGSTVDDATISTSDITTNNASTSKHGWLRKLDNNSAHFLDGQGGWTTPSGSADLAGKELDYVQITSNVNVTATTEATANTIVTGSSVAYDGSTVVMVEFWANHSGPAAGANDIRFWLYDGSSSIGFMGYQQADGSGQIQYGTMHAMRRITPSNASHTYSVRASVSGSTGVVAAGAGGSGNVAPAFIRITRVSS